MPATINADNGVVSGSAGVKTTADTSGELALQSNGVTQMTVASTGVSLATGGAVVGATATQTLTNKTLQAANLTGATQFAGSSGTTGQVLTSAGSGAAPAWANPAAVNLATGVTGTLPVANGGTGQTTRQEAMDALAGAVTAGQYLRGNGTDVVMSAIQAADVPTLNQNTTGTAGNVSGTVAASNGGTGRTTLTANNVILGNGTSAVNFVAPGTSGNLLTSNGSSWVSQAAGGSSPFVLVSSFTVSNVTTITIDSSVITSAYDDYFVTFDGVTPSAGGYGGLRYELNNGSSWVQSGYSFWNDFGGSAGSASSQTEVLINGNQPGASQPYLDNSYTIYIEVDLIRINETAGRPKLSRHSGSFSVGQQFAVNFTGACYSADLGGSPVRGIRFTNGQSYGMTGRVRVFGIRNS